MGAGLQSFASETRQTTCPISLDPRPGLGAASHRCYPLVDDDDDDDDDDDEFYSL